MEILGSIYKVTNLCNNRCYIGQTSQKLEKRWKNHINDVKRLEDRFHLAIKQWGVENFKIELVERCPIIKLNERETYYIDKFNTFVEGYNSSRGGGYNDKKRGVLKLQEHASDIISLYLDEGYSTNSIAKNYNVNKRCIVDLLNGCNINLRVQGLHLNPLEVSELIEKFNSGYSYSKLAKEYDVSGSTIKRFLKENGVPIKDRPNILEDENKCLEIRNYYLEFYPTYLHVMLKFNISFRTLKSIIQDCKKPYRQKLLTFTKELEEIIISKYKEILKIRPIAREYNVDFGTIQRILIRNNILKTV